MDSHRHRMSFALLLSIVLIEFTLIHPLTVWAVSDSLGTQKYFDLTSSDSVAVEESPALTNSIKQLKQSKQLKELAVVSEKKKRELIVVATAYSSSVEETDSDPCTTANGFNVCKNNIENVIAANFLPFGTRVRIPELYGDRTFTVHDRMYSRYGNGRIDVWLKTKQSARQFGVKRIKMEVVEDQVAISL